MSLVLRRRTAGLFFVLTLATDSLFGSSPVLVPATKATIAVGNAPTGIATGDFNGDGKPDFAVANSGSNTVSIFLGSGGGVFTQEGNPIPVGSTPMAIVVKDFNGDLIPDLAVVNQNSNNVTILLGNGIGAFKEAIGSPYAVGGTPTFGTTADFNGDGKADLAISNSSSNTVTVLLGNGAGAFAPSTGSPFATGPTPWAIVSADFDQDSKADIAVTDGSDGNVSYLFGDGMGGFSPFVKAQGANPGSAIVASLYGMALGDFYNHSLPDLVTVSSYPGFLNILRSHGFGQDIYNNQFSVYGCSNVVAGDFDGDGNQDALVTCPNYNQIFFLAGNGNGSFNYQTGPTFATGVRPYAAATADFNGDGRPDVVVSNAGDNTVSIFLTTGPVAPVAPPAPVPVAPANPVAAPQTIFFTVPDHLGSDAPFPLQASATSGLPVSFNILGGPATLNGNTLALTGLGTVTVLASQSGNTFFAPASVIQTFNVTVGLPSIKSIVNGASLSAGPVAASYYATLFGSNLASGSSLGDANKTQTLEGTSLTVTDSAKQTLAATISFMSFSQINFVAPAGLAPGPATVTVTNATGKSASIAVTIGPIAPGVFSADGTGAGGAAADVLVVAADGSQTLQSATSCTPFLCSPQAIPLPSGAQVYLVLFGTGIRGRSGLGGVSVTLGGSPATVTYAAAQGNYAGVDQVDVLIPGSMAGAGTVDVKLTVDGVAANTVKINLR